MAGKHQQPSYPLRAPEELIERLRRSAGDAKRSLNAEIVARLEASFDPKPQQRWEKEFLGEFMQELEKNGFLREPPKRKAK